MSEYSQAVPAFLGTRLLTAAKAIESRRSSPASSGFALIDERALDGGFRYGEITLISGASRSGKTLITYHTIASHLLNCNGGEAAVIDTTGSFSPLRLRDVLRFRLHARRQYITYQHSGYMYENASSKGEDGQAKLIGEATSMLDRVKVMRVFDFAGVVEAVGEIRAMREKLSLETEVSAATATGSKAEVRDSEEELDGDDTPPVGAAKDIERRADDSIGMIVVDTFTNVVSSVMSMSQVHGQALLASFMRSFHHLTTYYNICAILTNALVGINPKKTTEYPRRADEHVSIFSSTLGKPALGKAFTYLVDASILMSTLPKTGKDASIAFGNNPNSSFGKALVLEVTKDKRGTQEGRWAAFEIVDSVKLVPYPR